MILLPIHNAYGFDFSTWDLLLKEHVHDGNIQGIRLKAVDYRAMGADKRFSALVGRLEVFDPDELKTKDEKLSFWINAYNILAVKTVLDNYPVESIRDVGSIFRSVWKMPAGKINGRTYSLDEIEHSILRKLEEPRIHFAIVCASLSCPDLRKEAFTPEDLDEQLEENTRIFINSPDKGLKVDDARKTIYISSIFKWFKEDFESRGGVRKFISNYVPSDVKAKLTRGSYWTDYLNYNRSLNDSSKAD